MKITSTGSPLKTCGVCGVMILELVYSFTSLDLYHPRVYVKELNLDKLTLKTLSFMLVFWLDKNCHDWYKPNQKHENSQNQVSIFSFVNTVLLLEVGYGSWITGSCPSPITIRDEIIITTAGHWGNTIFLIKITHILVFSQSRTIVNLDTIFFGSTDIVVMLRIVRIRYLYP